MSWDHPRVCGKDQIKAWASMGAPGSPPRMRERLPDNRKNQVKNRITPAYAGKTFMGRWVNREPQDHPRVCGKDFYRLMANNELTGSPPRMRERPLSSPSIWR